MFKTILAPHDGSPLSEKAVHAAIRFAEEYGCKLVGISVAEPYPYSPLSETAFSDERMVYEDKMRTIAEEHAQKIVDAARARNVPVETIVTQSFSPYEEIINAAAKWNCDVIFMASHGRKGMSRLFIGSETQKVLANTTIPVMVFR
ncbi:MAG TPA: universal stress protein [Noviherbaspirillum sp.]|nr:universal stress protein [Noviherbaspirillum sp.]